MTYWQASVDLDVDSDLDEQQMLALADLTDGRGGAWILMPHRRIGGTFTAEGNTIRLATLDALSVVAEVARMLPGRAEVAALEVLSDQEAERRVAEPPVPPLVALADIARLGGVTRQRAGQWAAAAGFPPEVARTEAGGGLWSRAAVEAWLATRNSRPGRRPRTAASK